MALAGFLMLLIGGFAVVFGARPPYGEKQRPYASMIETARSAGTVLCLAGTVLLVVGAITLAVDG